MLKIICYIISFKNLQNGCEGNVLLIEINFKFLAISTTFS